jgi:hypothetical protein
MKLLSHFMELGCHLHIQTCQVWARGSKVTGWEAGMTESEEAWKPGSQKT